MTNVPEEFEALLYCYHCGKVLNQIDDPLSREQEPQTCVECAQPYAIRVADGVEVRRVA